MSTATLPLSTNQAVSAEDDAMDIRHAKRTFTLNHAGGPLVVDVWEPRRPSEQLPILLIHGWGGSGGYWTSTAHALSAGNRVIVPDLPGTGRSQPVMQRRDLFQQVEALGDVLDELEIGPVQVVGHSMGGAMALLLADARPQQVERLVLTSLCFFRTKAQEQIYRGVMKVFSWGMAFRPPWLADLPVVSQFMARRYFHRVPDDPRLLRQGLTDYLELDFGTAMACADDACNPRIPQAGARVQAPVLLVACRQDQVMPVENVEFTVAAIPNCRAEWIDACGHMPMIEKPQEYLAILGNFLHLG